jgi:hypothetical protein
VIVSFPHVPFALPTKGSRSVVDILTAPKRRGLPAQMLREDLL